MNLTIEEFELGKKIVEDCLKLDDENIKIHIQDSVKSVIDKYDTTKLDDRNKIFSFLKHTSTLFMNYYINTEFYLLGEKEKEKSHIGMKTISDIVKDFTESGF